MSTDHETLTPERARAVRALREALAEAGTADVRPPYDPRVEPGLRAVQELAGDDPEYLENIDAVSEQGIATASLVQLGTVVTFLLRGERYTPGFIGGGIANGKVAAVLDRLVELLPGLEEPSGAEDGGEAGEAREAAGDPEDAAGEPGKPGEPAAPTAPTGPAETSAGHGDEAATGDDPAAADATAVALAVQIAEDPHGWLERTGEGERPDRDAPVLAVLCRMGAGLAHDLAATLGLTPREVFRQVQVSTLEALAPRPEEQPAAPGSTADAPADADRLQALALAEQAAEDAHLAMLAVENGPDSEYFAAAVARMGAEQAAVTFGVLLHRIAATVAGSTETGLDDVLDSLRGGLHAAFDAGRVPVEPEEQKLTTLHGVAVDLAERALTDSALHKRVATLGDPTTLWTMMCGLGVAHVHMVAQDRGVEADDVWRQLDERLEQELQRAGEASSNDSALEAEAVSNAEPADVPTGTRVDAETAARLRQAVPVAWAAMREGPESRPFLSLTLMAPLPAQIVAFGVGLERILALAGEQFDTSVEEIRHVLRTDGLDELLGRDLEADDDRADARRAATDPAPTDRATTDRDDTAAPAPGSDDASSDEPEAGELMVDPAHVQRVLAELVASDDEGVALAEAARDAAVPGAFLLLVAERIVAAGVAHVAQSSGEESGAVFARLRAALDGQEGPGEALTPAVVLGALEAGPAHAQFTALYDAPDGQLVPALVEAVRAVDDAARA